MGRGKDDFPPPRGRLQTLNRVFCIKFVFNSQIYVKVKIAFLLRTSEFQQHLPSTAETGLSGACSADACTPSMGITNHIKQLSRKTKHNVELHPNFDEKKTIEENGKYLRKNHLNTKLIAIAIKCGLWGVERE